MQEKKVDEEGRPYVQIDSRHTIRLELEEVTDEWKLKAEKELRETPENIEKALQELRQLLKGKFCWSDKLFLILVKVETSFARQRSRMRKVGFECNRP